MIMSMCCAINDLLIIGIEFNLMSDRNEFI